MITIHKRYRRTDRQTTCDRNTALCTKVHRAVKSNKTVGHLNPANFLRLSTQTGSVERVAAFKLIGINFEANLSWSLHINTIIAKASNRLYF